MSRMIPPIIHHTCQSGGEKRLFRSFKTSPDTEDWVVLHSVGIAKHEGRLAGEIDFLVIVPGSGVVCIEVKGGNVSCTNGMWHYPYGDSPRSPFTQCVESMHSLRNYIAKEKSSLRKLLFISSVIFTDVDVDVQNPEWHDWQNIGKSKLGSVSFHNLSRVCRNVLGQAHKLTANTESAKWYDSISSRPNREQVGALTELLRPEFEFYVSEIHKIDEVDHEMLKFTREQFRVLDQIRNYSRAGFHGPAGTGKTLLALECLRREVANGRNTAIFCYNRALGNWLKNETQDIKESASDDCFVWAGTFLSYALYLLNEPVPSVPSHDFWTKELPKRIVDKMLEGKIPIGTLDSFILDEAQDFRSEEWLNLLDLLLAGGLGDGRWFYFGDFNRQAIYGLKVGPEYWNFATRNMPPELELSINCRNTNEIRTYVERISAMNPPYDMALNEVQGPPPRLMFFDDVMMQKNMLVDLLNTFQKNNYPLSSIVILSPKGKFSCSSQLSESDKLPLVHFDDETSKGKARFTTIQSFKGLESPTIIITDITSIQDELSQSLLYIGMSRACQQLFILLDERTRESFRNIIST